MSVRSGQSITIDFTTRAFSSGAATNADSLPTGTLVVNGIDSGATVTVTNKATGIYKAAVTLPTLAVGDVVTLRIAATVATIADNAVVWRDTKDVAIDSTGAQTLATAYDAAKTAAQAGDAMNLQTGAITASKIASGAITDSAFTLPTEATGTPSTFLQLVMWIAGMFGWRKVIKDSTTITQYMANSSTVKTTSAYTSASGTDTISKAS